MPEIALTVDVAAPADQLWAAVTDWPGQGQWMIGTSVRGTAQGGRGVGGGIEAFTGVGSVGFLDRMTITRWDPPYRCEVEHLGWVVRGSAVFEVVPVDEGHSRFIWAEWLTPPLGLVGAIGFALVRPFAVLGVRASLARLARWAPGHPVVVGETAS
jgi:Polyketide cyclase / dehydrase and lipid transport